MNPHPLHWKVAILTTGPIGKSLHFVFLFFKSQGSFSGQGILFIIPVFYHYISSLPLGEGPCSSLQPLRDPLSSKCQGGRYAKADGGWGGGGRYGIGRPSGGGLAQNHTEGPLLLQSPELQLRPPYPFLPLRPHFLPFPSLGVDLLWGTSS